MRALAILGLVLAVSFAGCENARTCDGACPAVGDTYEVQDTLLSGDCGFVPWLVPPTLVLAQEAGSERVTLRVIDPVNQVAVDLAVTLRVPEDGESLATFHGFQRTLRQASSQGELLELQIQLSGSISDDDGRRRLVATMTTQPVWGGGCLTTQTVTAVGSAIPSVP
ncbi:MAG: hypothetical protein HY901_24710 [Deltaproteobacteria bacterium]|nr:hypothetical protein [Deltaproteobacteria bacterium]